MPDGTFRMYPPLFYQVYVLKEGMKVFARWMISCASAEGQFRVGKTKFQHNFPLEKFYGNSLEKFTIAPPGKSVPTPIYALLLNKRRVLYIRMFRVSNDLLQHLQS